MKNSAFICSQTACRKIINFFFFWVFSSFENGNQLFMHIKTASKWFPFCKLERDIENVKGGRFINVKKLTTTSMHTIKNKNKAEKKELEQCPFPMKLEHFPKWVTSNDRKHSPNIQVQVEIA